MQNLRNAKFIARFVLVWFAMALGVAIASPLVQPKGMQVVCSGSGAMKVLADGVNGDVPQSGHTLDCPLCAGVSALPPFEWVAFAGGMLQSPAMTAWRDTPLVSVLSAPPPARGPPALI